MSKSKPVRARGEGEVDGQQELLLAAFYYWAG